MSWAFDEIIKFGELDVSSLLSLGVISCGTAQLLMRFLLLYLLLSWTTLSVVWVNRNIETSFIACLLLIDFKS